jgi:hypothetical protein
MKDPYLELQILSSELWNKKKGLDWTPKGRIENELKKIEKIISQIRLLDFETENKMLRELYSK